jgi:aspartate 1-decarboxylase
MLKVVPVFLINGRRRLQTYAILDDGSERAIILTSAASQPQLKGPEEIINLKPCGMR